MPYHKLPKGLLLTLDSLPALRGIRELSKISFAVFIAKLQANSMDKIKQ